jgi:hypothetical protein
VSTKAQTVVVVEHGAERAAQRGGITVDEVRADVVAALAAGRCGTRRPVFLTPGKNAYARREFVWNAAQTRVYVIACLRGGMIRVVVTTLTPWRVGDFIPEQGATALGRAFERAERAA